MSLTQTIRTALVADLTAITTGNGFSNTVDAVRREPSLPSEMQNDVEVCIFSGPGGISDDDTLTNRVGLATHNFIVRLFVNTSTPNQDMDDLLDDVRNAVERDTGNMRAVANVETVTATDWTEPTTDETIHQDVYLRDVTISITYYYNRGSL